MAVLTITDAVKETVITSTVPIGVTDCTDVLRELAAIDGMAAEAVLDTGVLTLTLADARELEITIDGTAVSIVSAAAWHLDELMPVLRFVQAAKQLIVAYGVSAFTVTYA